LSDKWEHDERRNLMGLVNFGLFLVTVGIVFVITPGLYNSLVQFVRDFRIAEISPGIFFPQPIHNHAEVYGAFYIFCLLFGGLHIITLAGRFAFKDDLRRKTSTLASMIFWLGSAYITSMLIALSIAWPAFVGYIIAVGGVCIVLESLILLAVRH
jgi:hypothetical protein